MGMKNTFKQVGYKFTFLDLNKICISDDDSFLFNGVVRMINKNLNVFIRQEFTYNLVATCKCRRKVLYLLDNTSSKCREPERISF